MDLVNGTEQVRVKVVQREEDVIFPAVPRRLRLLGSRAKRRAVQDACAAAAASAGAAAGASFLGGEVAQVRQTDRRVGRGLVERCLHARNQRWQIFLVEVYLQNLCLGLRQECF